MGPGTLPSDHDLPIFGSFSPLSETSVPEGHLPLGLERESFRSLTPPLYRGRPPSSTSGESLVSLGVSFTSLSCVTYDSTVVRSDESRKGSLFVHYEGLHVSDLVSSPPLLIPCNTLPPRFVIRGTGPRLRHKPHSQPLYPYISTRPVHVDGRLPRR